MPADSSWGKKTWRCYSPHWFTNIIDGVSNIIRWIPTIYKDKDWDDYYITKLLQVKIEHQREYLVKHNRHVNVDYDNFWMTVVLNLIEREHKEYYALEKYDYIEFNKEEPLSEYTSENLQDYINKYPGTYRRAIKSIPPTPDINTDIISTFIGAYRQEKCRKLLFKILEQKSRGWWD